MFRFLAGCHTRPLCLLKVANRSSGFSFANGYFGAISSIGNAGPCGTFIGRGNSAARFSHSLVLRPLRKWDSLFRRSDTNLLLGLCGPAAHFSLAFTKYCLAMYSL